MLNSRRSIVRLYCHMIIVWVVAIFLFFFLRTFGLPEHLHNQGLENHMPTHFPVMLNLLVGIIAGILFASSELFFSRPKFKRWSFRNIFLLKSITYFIGSILMLFFGILLSSHWAEQFLNLGTVKGLMMSKVFWVILIYFFIVINSITFVRQVSQKFGPGILWKMLKGSYHHPQEDQRVFMFLDLKSSTTIAEEIGHIKFSQFIQDCFYDLNEIVPDYKAEIYQYVGDEAILSWSYNDGFLESNCIEVFFAFMNRLQEKSAYYLEKYNSVPTFKAGVHLGKVTVAEIGVVKKEIAYHGDVLNTAARIQDQCNILDQKLLISKALLDKLVLKNPLKSIDMGKVQLKGKMQTVALYAIANQSAI